MINIYSKILELGELCEKVVELKQSGNKIIHCHGVFDLLHPGHFRHFQEARSLGDVLVVTLTPDRFVKKGDGRPAFSEDLRQECVASLEYVDLVSLNNSADAIDLLAKLAPDIYVKGPDYKDPKNDPTGNIGLEVEAVEKVGGKIHYTEDITFSSTALINKYFSPKKEYR